MGQKTIDWTCAGCGLNDSLPNWKARRKQYCTVKCRANNLTASKKVSTKISNTLKRKGIRPPSQRGVVQTPETKAKRAEALRMNWASGKRKPTKPYTISPEGLSRKIAATQTMRRRLAARGKLTDIEKIIDRYLHMNNIEHEHEYPVGAKVMDFYLPDHSVFIEADSDYWHQDKRKDADKDMYVNKLMPEIQIIRCPEKAIKDTSWINLVPWGKKRNV